jgi:hypothetical protein
MNYRIAIGARLSFGLALWAKRDGQWRLIAAHISEVKP